MDVIKNLFTYILLPNEINDGEKSKLLWLTRLRWFYILFQFLFAIPFLTLSYSSYPKYTLYLGLCFMLLAFNSIQYGLVKNIKNKISSHWVFFNLVFDLILFAGLYSILLNRISFSVELMFFVHVTLGAVLLRGFYSCVFYVLNAFFLGYFQLTSNVLNDEIFLVNTFFFQIVLFLIWWISGSLNRYLLEHINLVNNLKLNITRQDRLRAIGALAGSFSHEFATPLNTLKLRLNRIERASGSTDDVIEAKLALENCSDVISKINISQLDSEDFIFQEIEFNSFLSEIINSWKEEKKIFVKLNSAEGAITGTIPVLNFSQAIINLLDNSFESFGTTEIEVDLYRIAKDNQVSLSVRDNGSGFDQNILAKIGKPFVTSKVSGVGLGIYSIVLFVESLGGKISFSKNNLKGAKVDILIPLRNQ